MLWPTLKLLVIFLTYCSSDMIFWNTRSNYFHFQQPDIKRFGVIYFKPRKCKAWSDVLTLVELLFMIVVANAKLERMSLKLTHIKTNCWSRLTEIRLDSLLKIAEDGPNLEIMTLVLQWAKDKIWWTNQAERSTYKQWLLNKSKMASLSDSDLLNSGKITKTSLFEENGLLPLCEHRKQKQPLGGVIWEKVFLKILQNLQESTCARVYFLIKMQAKAFKFIQKETLVQLFPSEFCKISKNIFFPEHSWATASVNTKAYFLCLNFYQNV